MADLRARFRLAVRRLAARGPVVEIWHVACPLVRRECPCMEGWDGA